jgi:hypothetical protein
VNWRRWRNLGLVALTSAALLECLLQAGAFVMWLGTRTGAQPAAPGDARTVLCVGDSFTFGVGSTSSEHAYPQTLQRLLHESSGDQSWRVVNGGMQGQDSRDVLRRLGGQLAQHRPAFVCVMVGCNDWWNRPGRLEQPPASGEEFQWRWRTGRMLALVAQLFRPRGFPAGAWRLHDLRLQFGGDQVLAVSWSFPPIAVARLPWRAQDQTLTLGDGLTFRWQAAGSELWLYAEGVPAPLVLTAENQGESGTPAVLRDHLRTIIARCRAAGATPILMSYPAPMFGVEEVIRPLAEQEHVIWIHHRERFDQELRTRAHAELFAPDGHCADAGYRLLAEGVLPVLLQAVR